MRKINLKDIEDWEWKSPGGNYAASFKGISEALGRDPNSLDLAKRHPFDLELTRVPPGKPNFPYHSHSAQWELYFVIAGKGSVRDENGTTEVVAGDAFIFAPNEPHQSQIPARKIWSITLSPTIRSVNLPIFQIAGNGRSTSSATNGWS